MRVSLIIPTRNRPRDIRALLSNLSEQTVRPAQVIVIDSSDEPQLELKREFPGLVISYQIFTGEPSAAAQRNAGLQHVAPDVELIGFADDDIVFDKDALEQMQVFWSQAPEDVCGAAFNFMGLEPNNGWGLKRSGLASRLGLYRAEAGAVAPSGWHTRIGSVDEDTVAEWVGTGAVVWRRKVLNRHRFDPFFQGYSYLEDLDFSYGVSRECTLMIVADARFRHFHHHDEWDKHRLYDFGKMEVRNRLFFVKKHNLSVARCYAGLFVRTFMTLADVITIKNKGSYYRAKGNLAGMLHGIFRR